MKNTQNFRNQINRAYRNATNSMRHVPLSMLIGVMAFGHLALGFFKQLVTEGAGPFAGLNRGQLRRMSFLFAMYRC